MVKRSNPVIGFPAPTSEAEFGDRLASPIDGELPEPMDPVHRAAVEEGRAQFRRGEIATDEEIEAAFRRFGP